MHKISCLKSTSTSLCKTQEICTKAAEPAAAVKLRLKHPRRSGAKGGCHESADPRSSSQSATHLDNARAGRVSAAHGQRLPARPKKIRPAREDANESTTVFFPVTLPDRRKSKGL